MLCNPMLSQNNVINFIQNNIKSYILITNSIRFVNTLHRYYCQVYPTYLQVIQFPSQPSALAVVSSCVSYSQLPPVSRKHSSSALTTMACELLKQLLITSSGIPAARQAIIYIQTYLIELVSNTVQQNFYIADLFGGVSNTFELNQVINIILRFIAYIQAHYHTIFIYLEGVIIGFSGEAIEPFKLVDIVRFEPLIIP